MRANAVVATALLGLMLAMAGPAAAGVDKTLGRLEGVQKSQTDWRANTTIVIFKKGAVLDPAKLAKGMDDAGFGLGELRIVARGRYAEEGGRPAFQASDSGQVFLLASGELLRRLQGIGRGREVTITAKVDLQAGGPPWTLGLEQVEP